jgi:hypothetical protein
VRFSARPAGREGCIEAILRAGNVGGPRARRNAKQPLKRHSVEI